MCNSSKCLETLYTGKCQRANPSATSSLAVGLISEQRSDKLGIRGSPKARSKVLQQPFNRWNGWNHVGQVLPMFSFDISTSFLRSASKSSSFLTECEGKAAATASGLCWSELRRHNLFLRKQVGSSFDLLLPVSSLVQPSTFHLNASHDQMFPWTGLLLLHVADNGVSALFG